MFTSAWHLNSVYPKIKQQKLQHWMQETDLRVWVSSPAQACFEGTLLSAERAAVADPATGWLDEGEAGGSAVVPTMGFGKDAELSRAGRAPGGHWAQAK